MGGLVEIGEDLVAARARLVKLWAWGAAIVAWEVPVLLSGRMLLLSQTIVPGRVLVWSIVFAVVPCVALFPVRRRNSRCVAIRSSVLCVGAISLVAYPALASIAGANVATNVDAIYSTLYLIGLALLLWACARVWQAESRVFLAIMSTIVLTSAAAALHGAWDWYLSGPGDEARTAQERLSAPVNLGATAANDPDIVHIVLDGFGRPDVLAQEYGIAPTELEPLQIQGLTFSEEATANYTQTYESLASMFNMQYLDSLARPLHDSLDRRPLINLIANSAVLRSLKQRGYTVIVVGSGFDVTPHTADSSACFNCGPAFPGFFETGLLYVSPLRSLVSWRPFFAAHKDRVVSSLEFLRRLPSRGPLFVWAHIMAPHPPFILGRRTDPELPHTSFEIGDETHFAGTSGEYRTGYAEQVRYVLDALRGIVAAIGRSRSRAPLIIVSGDHGPGMRYDPYHPSSEGNRERFGVLLAARWPDPDRQPEVRSLVNLYRVVFDTVFGARLPLLPDRHYLVTPTAPYAFVSADPR